MSTIVKSHPITSNMIYINNQHYFWINGQRVIVGVENPDETETVVRQDEVTGLNYAEERKVVEGVEIYNCLKERHNSPWFILDLETGSRGWFPGSEIHGDILGENIELKLLPDEQSATVEIISNATVVVLDIQDVKDEPQYEGWYKIKYIKTGYIKKNAISNLRYSAPNNIN